MFLCWVIVTWFCKMQYIIFLCLNALTFILFHFCCIVNAITQLFWISHELFVVNCFFDLFVILFVNIFKHVAWPYSMIWETHILQQHVIVFVVDLHLKRTTIVFALQMIWTYLDYVFCQAYYNLMKTLNCYRF